MATKTQKASVKYKRPVKKANKRSSNRLVRFIQDHSRFALFVLIFVVLGGGYFLYQTLAAPDIYTTLALWHPIDKYVDGGDSRAAELGMRFTTTTEGDVFAMRFYKATGNTGTHVGTLWSSSGQKLATVTFKNETASGWQRAFFSKRVHILPGQTYVVSYHTDSGHFSNWPAFFTTKHWNGDNNPLGQVIDSSATPNGVIHFGSSAFPDQATGAANYFVDVFFVKTAPTPTPTPTPTTNNGAKLLWSDEFNGGAGSDVNASDWATMVGAPTNAGRLEYDTPGTTSKQMDGNGNLVITAKRQSYGGRGFTSARIEGTHPFKTGYAEFRAKMPTWPGMMPSTWFYNACGSNYPTSLCYRSDYAEIDLPEIVTNNDPTNARLTIHSDYAHDRSDGNLWQRGWNFNTYNFSPQKVGDSWHKFGVYVNPSDYSVTFYIDGKPFVKYDKNESQQWLAAQSYYNYQSDPVWPFGTQPLIPIIEIEIGGYSGTPDYSTNSDTLQVDYYRVYDKPPY